MATRRNGVVTSGPVALITRVWRTSHAPDYVGFSVLVVAWLILVLFVTPFQRMFFINDLRISYPHAEVERVSVFWLFIYGLCVPAGALILFNILARSPVTKHEVTYLPFLISMVLTLFLTDMIKNTVGRPRPDLLARCKPVSGIKKDTLVTIKACSAGRDHTLYDGWRSFPSGHSSFAFAGLGFLSLFLAGQLHLFHHPVGGRDLSRALICGLPLVGALMIAISRCEDYRHDVYDVCVGSLLGMSVAYWSYRRHWPRLSSARCDEPYPRPGTDSSAWQRVHDEEEAVNAAEEYELRETR